MKKLPEKIHQWRTEQFQTKTIKEILREQREEKKTSPIKEEKKSSSQKDGNKPKIVEHLAYLLTEIAELKPSEDQTTKMTQRIGQIVKLL